MEIIPTIRDNTRGIQVLRSTSRIAWSIGKVEECRGIDGYTHLYIPSDLFPKHGMSKRSFVGRQQMGYHGGTICQKLLIQRG